MVYNIHKHLWALSWLLLIFPSMNTSIRERGKSGFNQSKLLVPTQTYMMIYSPLVPKFCILVFVI